MPPPGSEVEDGLALRSSTMRAGCHSRGSRRRQSREVRRDRRARRDPVRTSSSPLRRSSRALAVAATPAARSEARPRLRVLALEPPRARRSSPSTPFIDGCRWKSYSDSSTDVNASGCDTRRVDTRDSAAELEKTIERYNDAWNAQDVEAILAFHAPGMVFQNHTAGDRVEGNDVGPTSPGSSSGTRTCGLPGVGFTRATAWSSANGRPPRPTATVAASSGTGSTSFPSRTA